MASPGNSIITAWSELASTTYRAHKKEIADNVSNHNALFRRIREKDNYQRLDGGLTIVAPLDYAENGTYQRYSGYDTLNIAASDVITSAEFQWRQAAVNITASGMEIRSNSGQNAFIKLLKARIKNAQRTFANNLSSDLYSDGTASNQINGLQAIIADAGTGTVGNINSGTYAFWQNKVQSAAAPLQGGSGITPGATTIESLMLPLWMALTRGNDMPDMIVMDDVYFAFYEQSQTSLKRYTSKEDGQGGMVSMKYKTADVFFDSSGGIPTNHAYFINSDYLELDVHKDADMEVMDELRSVNQDAVVIPVLFQGNLVVSNRALQGVMKA
jgi:hypothetical protein